MLGRFIQPDTVVPGDENPLAWDRYSYSFNLPLSYIDPDGHFPLLVPFIALIGMAIFMSQVPSDVPQALPGEYCGPPQCGDPGGMAMGLSLVGDAPAIAGLVGQSLMGVGAITGSPQIFGTGVSAMNSATGGAFTAAGNPPSAVDIGNEFHYDLLNGGQGYSGPTQLSDRYPETEFGFAPRGAAGPDVEYLGGAHPSSYPDSNWPESFNYGDFKPDTPSGARTFYQDLNSGKLPMDTVPLPYDRWKFKL